MNILVRLQEAGRTVKLDMEVGSSVNSAITMAGEKLNITPSSGMVTAINGESVVAGTVLIDGDYVTTTKGSTKSA